MFKRANKLTALLVAAAAIISVVPAIPAEAASRLESKDGKFESAVAYDGKYIYDGYKNDDESSIYVSDNKDDKEVDKADDYSDYNIKYGNKYVLAHESSNEDYLLDISTGKVNTESTIQDKKEDTASTLKRKLKNTDRYGKNVSVDDDDLTLLKQNTFGDVWYKYTAGPGSDAEDHADVTVDGDLFGFVKEDGTYIDASNKANLVVLSGGKTVKIDEFGKEKDGVTVSLKSIDVIAQDKDYIYAVTKVKVSGGSTAGAEENQTFVQKISKSVSGDKDGAKLPKNVDSYMLTDAFDGNDDDKAASLISASPSDSDLYTVKSGVLYLTQKSSSTKIKVTKFNMKKEKTALASDTSTKLDVYTVKVDDDESHDITSGSNLSVDVDGNVWGMNKGKIFKFDGLTATDVYTCDSGFNKLDVYNEKNLVAWDDSGEIYAAIVNGSGSTNSGDNNNNSDNNNNNNENNNGGNNNGGNNNGIGSNLNNGASTLVPSGWVKEGNNWYFKYSDGSNKTGWYYELGNWYYFYGNGQMATAFIDLGDGAIYYLNPISDGNQGVMKIGWQKINGYWYYFNPVSDSYGYQGMMARGWRNIGGTWYYFYYDGTMAYNTRIGGYYVNGSGAWIPGK